MTIPPPNDPRWKDYTDRWQRYLARHPGFHERVEDDLGFVLERQRTVEVDTAGDFFSTLQLAFPNLISALSDAVLKPLLSLIEISPQAVVPVRSDSSDIVRPLFLHLDEWELLRDEPPPTFSLPTPWILSVDTPLEPGGTLPLLLMATRLACRAELTLFGAESGEVLEQDEHYNIAAFGTTIHLDLPDTPGTYCAVFRSLPLDQAAVSEQKEPEVWLILFRLGPHV